LTTLLTKEELPPPLRGYSDRHLRRMAEDGKIPTPRRLGREHECRRKWNRDLKDKRGDRGKIATISKVFRLAKANGWDSDWEDDWRASAEETRHAIKVVAREIEAVVSQAEITLLTGRGDLYQYGPRLVRVPEPDAR
jgi:hypothetical protein